MSTVRGALAPNLQARAEAAGRLPVLPDRCGPSLAARDPWLTPRKPRSSTFSLTRAELRREAQRLLASGWQVHEVVAVFAPPEADAA